jgi:hypothetical protein
VPPAAVSDCEYGSPTVPVGSEVVWIAIGAAEITRFSACVANAAVESETLTLKLDEPAVVGVPEIRPEVERDRPVGRAPAANDHEYGGTPPETANEAE